MVTDAKSKAVTDASGVAPGDDITVRMKGGDIGARVTGGAQPKPKKKPAKKSDDAQGSLL